MGKALPLVLAAAVGAALGWVGATLARPELPDAAAPPERWVARVGSEYISEERFKDEMRHRGGMRPGEFQDAAQRQALLDTLVYQKALVAAARDQGLDQEPEVRRTLDQVLANQVLQRQLRERQRQVAVPDQAVRAFYEANADSYAVPARRRVAMIEIPVSDPASEEAWKQAMAEAEQALAAAARLDASVRHFGAVAREHSHDQASRYRGGVIGWLSEGQRDRYRYAPAVLDAAFALQEPGALAGPVRGTEAVYLVRLVDLQPAQTRSFEELEAGIRQRLTQHRVGEIEEAFRRDLVDRVEVDVREDVLAAIAPLSPPADPSPPQPPALPAEG